MVLASRQLYKDFSATWDRHPWLGITGSCVATRANDLAEHVPLARDADIISHKVYSGSIASEPEARCVKRCTHVSQVSDGRSS